MVEDPAAVAGTVPADGRVGDGHGALVEDPAAVVAGAGISTGHGKVLERHRKVGTVVKGGAAVAAVKHARGRGGRPGSATLDRQARLARATYRKVPVEYTGGSRAGSA